MKIWKKPSSLESHCKVEVAKLWKSQLMFWLDWYGENRPAACVESIYESKDGVHFIGKNMHLVWKRLFISYLNVSWKIWAEFLFLQEARDGMEIQTALHSHLQKVRKKAIRLKSSQSVITRLIPASAAIPVFHARETGASRTMTWRQFTKSFHRLTYWLSLPRFISTESARS